ncbi:portal protein [Cloacibacillus evryensis]|uniref:portal protein n=1 Tax=Cloacibacillus evryensis TaxID=508460 RepID=UPI00242010C9|nr:portal protein [Cloacibacillus evryensis]
MRDLKELKKKLQKRFHALSLERSKVSADWQELYDYIHPRRGRFNGTGPNEKKKMKLFDNAAKKAIKILAAGMQSGLTSPSQKWFTLVPGDPEMRDYRPVNVWLNEVEDIVYTVLAGSNYYTCTHSSYEEIGTIGTSVMIMLPDYDDVIRCHTFTGGEYYLGTSGARGRVDVFFEEIKMTAAQMAHEFGEDALSSAARLALQNAPDRWFDVLHAIEPNDGYVKDMIGAFGFPFLSAYWEKGGVDEEGREFLKLAGFDSFPVFAPRWDFCSSDIYGYGPGDEAVEDCKTLNLMKRDYLNAIKKTVDPPMMADSAYQDVYLDLGPGAVNFVSMGSSAGGRPITPIFDPKADISALLSGIQDARQSIRESFFVDLFMMVQNATDRDKTAREIAELHEEKLAVLGPVLERLSKEQHSPSIEACINYCNKAGLLPDPPEEMNGAQIKIEYTSMFAQAQKMSGRAPLEQFINFTGHLIQSAPDLIDVVDMDAAIRRYGELLSVPAEVLRSIEDVEERRRQRAQQQQQEQQMEEAARAAQITQQAAQGAKVMSDTPVSDSTLLDQIGGVL